MWRTGLYMCLKRMCPDENLTMKIDLGIFGYKASKTIRKEKSLVDWWDSYGAETPELRDFSMRILSLTCSSSGRERSWSAFKMEHSKRRNRPHQQGMNDLVYVMYNLQLTGRDENKRKEQQITGLETLNLNDVSSDDKWILQEESFNDNI
uniref:HAT C-terminal dimerisation domain-containing protein n=1 Tax=Lactuca sativa TaxID=4236 RepID=A0A9R1W0G7_LACSA|nr:hypothetical protein LSAT_V11C400220220 [Lactuca sativa]